MEGEFARYLEDVYSAPPIEREPLTDRSKLVSAPASPRCCFWYKAARGRDSTTFVSAKKAAMSRHMYWNRYPGIACDVESYSYLPLLGKWGYFRP